MSFLYFVIGNAQDVSINILNQPASLYVGSSSGQVTIEICNNDGGTKNVPLNKLRPLISLPSLLVGTTLVSISNVGWQVLSNNGSTIRFENTATIAAGQCSQIVLGYTAMNPGGPLTITGTMGFNGPQTVGNLSGNDNSTTSTTVNIDTDQDNLPDATDLDDDNDGILDTVEDGQLSADTDGDGIPNRLDLDSDNDGINDVIEAGGLDANKNGMADGTPSATGIPASAGAGTNPTDTDGDTRPNPFDLDSDNDGINDLVESGNPLLVDADGNGLVDGSDPDGDGILGGADGVSAIRGDTGDPLPIDTDGDITPNYKDLDSDGDGISDLKESGIPNPSTLDANNDGKIDGNDDPDGDGILTPVDGKNTFGDSGNPVLPDTDGDGKPDYIDASPIAIADLSNTVVSGSSIDIPVLSNDKNPDGTVATLTKVTTPVVTILPTKGTAIVNPDGSIKYTPTANQTGTDTFVYTICDKTNPSLCDTARVTINIACTKPVLTVQNIICSGTGTGYTIIFSSNATLTTNNGTLSGNTVTVSSGNATLTSTTSCGEVISMIVTAPICPVPAMCTQVPSLSVGNALCTGTGTYTVSFSGTNGTVTSNAGTVSGNSVVNIQIGTNALLTIIPLSTACNSQSITVISPISCATPSCTDGSVGISYSTACNNAGTYTINYTTSIAGTTVTSSANSFTNLTGTVTLTVTKPGCSTQSVVVNAHVCVVNTDVKLQLKVFLQGAFFSPSGATDALMRDNLRTLGVIPSTEPFTAMANSRFTKFSDTGGQAIGAGVLSTTSNDAIVDWVFVELRDAANPATVLKTRAALVQRDGDVVEASDGVTPVTFAGAVGASYYVSIKHRNHLGAMTATAITMSGTGTIVDFTSMSSAQTWDKGLVLSDGTLGSYDGSEQVTLGNGKKGLWAGNARNADNKVKYSGSAPDPATLLSQVITYSGNTGFLYNYDFVTPVYLSGDLNMDGKVKYAGTSTDTAFILFNIINKYPNNIVNKSYNFDFMIEQIP